jgi:type IV pilus assembly protein PilN
MIRINLLGGERKVQKKAAAFDLSKQGVTIASSLLIVLTAAGVGYWYYLLQQQAARIEADIARARQEQARLRSILTEVNDFDTQRAQLQQRVRLIEQLRSGQSVPVQLLDAVSKSVPDMLWLTEMEQKGGDVTIQGQSTTLISVSDFVGNLGNAPLLQNPIEIVNSTVETVQTPGAGGTATAGIDLIKFTVKASLATAPSTPEAAPPPARAGGPGRGGARGGGR